MDSTFKTFMMMTVLTVLFVWVGGTMGGQIGAIIAFVMAAGMNLYAYWFSDKMVLKRYKARVATAESHPRLYNIVSDLAERAQLPMPKVYVIPQQTPNAFATGRNPENAAVAATEGILGLLDDDELAGVMAHELAHVRHRDILTGTMVATIAGAITMVSQISRFGTHNRRNQNPLGMILMMVGAPLAAMFIRMAISRVREFEADRGGAEISGQPLGLANALNKLHQGVARYPLQRGNAAHAHMFIMNPFRGGLQKLFATHPPVEERVQRLEALAGEMHPAR